MIWRIYFSYRNNKYYVLTRDRNGITYELQNTYIRMQDAINKANELNKLGRNK